MLSEVIDGKYLVPGKYNCSRTRGKEKLPAEGLKVIKGLVFNLYDTPVSQQDFIWGQCVKAIDELLRKKIHARVQNV